MKEVEIEAFLAVVDMGSISAAANSLYISQPALSRRISSLEEELGYLLFVRNKGVRNIEITPKGRAFIVMAKRWKALFLESKGIGAYFDNKANLNLGVIGSVSTYLLPAAFRSFINEHPECQLNIHQYHSEECYYHMEKGELDLALVGKERFSKILTSVPVIRAPFKLVTAKKDFAKGAIHPSQLDPSKEILVSWNNRFENWHDYWFAAQTRPKVCLDMMSLLEYFISEKDTWVIAPTYIASYLAEKFELNIYELIEPPPPMTVYAVFSKDNSSIFAQQFLQAVGKSLDDNIELQSFL